MKIKRPHGALDVVITAAEQAAAAARFIFPITPLRFATEIGI